MVTQQQEKTTQEMRAYTLVLADTTLVDADADRRKSIIDVTASSKAGIIIADAEALAEEIKEEASVFGSEYANISCAQTNPLCASTLWGCPRREPNRTRTFETRSVSTILS